jgi:hypothetical protein
MFWSCWKLLIMISTIYGIMNLYNASRYLTIIYYATNMILYLRVSYTWSPDIIWWYHMHIHVFKYIQMFGSKSWLIEENKFLSSPILKTNDFYLPEFKLGMSSCYIQAWIQLVECFDYPYSYFVDFSIFTHFSLHTWMYTDAVTIHTYSKKYVDSITTP